MKLVVDIETNRLVNPDKIWCIVAKEIESGTCHRFRNVSEDDGVKQEFISLVRESSLIIGHNLCGFDLPVCRDILNLEIPGVHRLLDTLIISRLVDYPRDGHSVEDYGLEFGFEKIKFDDWTKWSQEMEDYCLRDVEITEKIYKKYLKYINNPDHRQAIELEHKFQFIVNDMEKKGFGFDIPKAEKLLSQVKNKLEELDEEIKEQFPPRLKLIREITPKETKYGTISLSSIPKLLRNSMSEFSIGASFSYCTWVPFNPSSPKQVVTILNEAGWKPEDKTKTHILTEREYNKLSRMRKRPKELDLKLKELYNDLQRLGIYGWKINEKNLSTLPPSAPPAARTLALRILYESRRRTLTEWLSLVDPKTSRIYGKFQSIGAWTHRMSHQKPNLANITNEYDTQGKVKLLGKELRQCWRAPKGRLLCGVDAEGIQLRIFGHYINDPEFIEALVKGKKDDKTDPHSLNQRILGNVCKSRAAAKRFIYALLLGAGLGKLSEILECDQSQTQEALDRLLTRYSGWATLKEEVFPKDAKRGWFTGLDGRKISIPSDTESGRRHLAMSGYLQSGEAIVVKTAATIADPEIKKLDSFIVDLIHDEAQNETPNNMEVALEVAQIWDKAIVKAGEIYGLRCPMAGSYQNDHGDYSIGINWYQTH